MIPLLILTGVSVCLLASCLFAKRETIVAYGVPMVLGIAGLLVSAAWGLGLLVGWLL